MVLTAGALTGVNATALGFGLNEDACAFSRFAAAAAEVGDIGLAGAAEAPVAVEGVAPGFGDFALFLLKGGMG